ncbi:patatin-like phospholipase family protein [Nocardioides stalactiti]|uniref:patatin-like phospholipase family protein n=1 Tax=Nocardioides stalactiti TaxID=2755356 RepID=UPI0016024D51|nr:patatin-like phospholipase family protein [Nocardioides stalactiti]
MRAAARRWKVRRQDVAPEPELLDVAGLVRRRLAGDRSDSATLALVIEGGGMRGVVSAAMAAALERAGVTECLDLVVGTSAGSVNGAAVVAGTADAMATSYAEVFAGRREYADPRRLITRAGPAVDAARIVAATDELLDLARRALARPLIRFAAVATDVATAQPVALEEHTDPAALLRALQASSTLPVVGGPPVDFRDRRWLDGGISDAVPVATARDLGATHAIVLATRPAGNVPGWGPADAMIERYLRRLNPDLASSYRARPERYAEERAAIASGLHLGVETLLLAPGPGDPVPGRMERDAEVLRQAQRAADRTATMLIDGWFARAA